MNAVPATGPESTLINPLPIFGSNGPWFGTRQLLQRIIEGEVVQVSPHSVLFPIAQLFANLRSSIRWASAGGPSVSKLLAR
jgi:hypothetical protein